MTPLEVVILGFFVIFGAATQRITGMGFALVASPFLVMLVGTGNGVPLTQVLSLIASSLVLAQTFRDAELRKAVPLAIFGFLGILPGAWLARTLPTAWLQIVIGAMVIIALTAIVASERARVFKGRTGLASAGFLSGFMNVTAGVGGPAVVLYSLSIKWPHAAFVATSQAYFITLNLMSLLVQGFPKLPGSTLAIAVGCLLGGLVVGTLLARRVSADLARLLVIIVAFAGSTATVIKGIVALL